MAWARLDDQFFYNKKVAQVDGPAKLLYIAGLVYVANQLTDGFIPEKAVKFIASTADVANCQEFARQLLDVGLWDATDGGYQIHDFLTWNPSKEQVEHTREARAQSGRRGGLAKAAKVQQNSSKLPSKTLANDWQKSAPSPSPSLIVNSQANGTHGSNGRAKSKPEPQPNPDYQPMFEAVCQLTQLDPKLRAAAIGKTVKNLLAAGYTVESVTTLAAWWRRNDFRGKQGQAPTLSQVEETISKCKPVPAAPERDDYAADPATRAVREARKAAV